MHKMKLVKKNTLLVGLILMFFVENVFAAEGQALEEVTEASQHLVADFSEDASTRGFIHNLKDKLGLPHKPKNPKPGKELQQVSADLHQPDHVMDQEFLAAHEVDQEGVHQTTPVDTDKVGKEGQPEGDAVFSDGSGAAKPTRPTTPTPSEISLVTPPFERPQLPEHGGVQKPIDQLPESDTTDLQMEPKEDKPLVSHHEVDNNGDENKKSILKKAASYGFNHVLMGSAAAGLGYTIAALADDYAGLRGLSGVIGGITLPFVAKKTGRIALSKTKMTALYGLFGGVTLYGGLKAKQTMLDSSLSALELLTLKPAVSVSDELITQAIIKQ